MSLNYMLITPLVIDPHASELCVSHKDDCIVAPVKSTDCRHYAQMMCTHCARFMCTACCGGS